MAAQLAYFSFDTVPAPKGAAVHIGAFVQAIATQLGPVDLVTVSPDLERHDRELWPQVQQTALPARGKTLIDRVLDFRHQLHQWLQGKRYQAIQIRSIYEGFPIALQKARYCDRLIFEVNGLPSIELKYRYPDLVADRELLHKLTAQEQICLEAADLIVTPSQVTQQHLISRGMAADRIQVIPNGVDLDVFSYQEPRSPHPVFHLLYAGTLAPWQGVTQAVEALGLYCRDFPGELTLIGPGRPPQVAALHKLARKLGVADHLRILDPLPQTELVQWMHRADAIAAPLTANDRNLVQGCCPLKVLEGMATGTPVIASDLPVVRELGQADVHLLLVKPGSAKGIKDAMLRLRADPALSSQISQAARIRVEQTYTWAGAGRSLVQSYQALGINASITVCN